MDQQTPSAAWQTFIAIIPSFLYTFISNVVVSILYSTKSIPIMMQFFIEFFLIIIPTLLNITLLKEYNFLIIVFSTIGLLLLIIKVLVKSENYNKLEKSKMQKTRYFITNARSTINCISVMAILAVDFQLIFPHGFSKSQHYGFSLMDLGVGLFVYANGIIDGLKPNFIRSVKTTISLLVLGALRFFLTTYLHYHVCVLEYGAHWNFFITLAASKIIVTILIMCFQVDSLHIVSITLMIMNECLLQMGIAEFVTSGETPRDNLISANREGIFSTMGYVNIYLLSAYISYFIDYKKTKNPRVTLIKFFGTALLFLILTAILTDHLQISRQLANGAYCCWIVFIGVFMTGLFYMSEIVLDAIGNKFKYCNLSPLIHNCINYNAMAFFLIGNVLTGLVNLSVDTRFMTAFPSFTILTGYMLLNCGLMCILHKYKIKLKLL